MQIVYIDLIPQKDKPVVNLSQFDNDRVVRFMLLENGAAYTLAGTEDVEIDIKKPDGNIVVIVPTIGADNYVDVYFTEQSAACYGRSFGEISIHDNSTIIGTCNFYLDVEISPTHGGIESDSAIANLQTQIDDIISGEGYLKADDVAPVALSGDYNDLTNKPDFDNYYTKSDTDTLLNAKADKSDTYTKAQVDSALSAKANTADLATVATTGDYDDLINKPTIPTNTSDLVNDSDFQNETEVNDLIADALLAVMPVDSATGNPCTFNADIATSLVGLRAEILATQAAGTPTPSNPLPISGISSLEITANGDTFTIDLGGTRYGGVYTADGKLRLTFTGIDMGSVNWDKYVTEHQVFFKDITDMKEGGAVVLCSCYETSNWVGIPNLADLKIEAHPSLNYVYIRDDNYTSAADFKTAVTGQTLMFELATPIEIDVSSISVVAVSGVNNITSNGNGDVTAQYKVSIQKYIDDHT